MYKNIKFSSTKIKGHKTELYPSLDSWGPQLEGANFKLWYNHPKLSLEFTMKITPKSFLIIKLFLRTVIKGNVQISFIRD